MKLNETDETMRLIGNYIFYAILLLVDAYMTII